LNTGIKPVKGVKIMGSSKSVTIDKELRRLLLLLNNGRLPLSVGVYNMGGLARAVTGSSGSAARKKVRASLKRLGVRIER